MFQLHDFFLDNGENGKAAKESSSTDDEAGTMLHSALLAGPPCSGKTTLLFHYAYNLVSKEGYSNVVFICKRSNMENDPPFLPEGFNTSSEQLQKICFKYVSDDEDLDKYFAAFHLANPLPEAVIIDSFSELLEEWLYEENERDGQPLELAMVNTLSYCLNAVEYASKILPSRRPCKLLISDTQDEGSGYMQFYEKYLSEIFIIKALEPSRFVLLEDAHCYAQYTFNDNPIQLDFIAQDKSSSNNTEG